MAEPRTNLPLLVPVKVSEPEPLIGPATVRVEFVGAKVAPLPLTTTPRLASRERSAVALSVPPATLRLFAVAFVGIAPRLALAEAVRVPPLR